MKLGFALPHMMNLKALTQPWELAIDGVQQALQLLFLVGLG